MSESNETPDPHPLERLRDAGFDLGMFDSQQLELLASLSEGELSVLLDIGERMGDVHADVEAHDSGMGMPMTIGGLLF
jgi:hypothetical protein